MTNSLKVFNETLQSLPKIRDELKQQILENPEWEKNKKAQALKILNAEQFELKSFHFTTYSSAYLKPNNIYFSCEECSIKYGNIEILEKYVEELLNDINHISSVIHFSISGLRETVGNEGRTFAIECMF